MRKAAALVKSKSNKISAPGDSTELEDEKIQNGNHNHICDKKDAKQIPPKPLPRSRGSISESSDEPPKPAVRPRTMTPIFKVSLHGRITYITSAPFCVVVVVVGEACVHTCLCFLCSHTFPIGRKAAVLF